MTMQALLRPARKSVNLLGISNRRTVLNRPPKPMAGARLCERRGVDGGVTSRRAGAGFLPVGFPFADG